MGTADEGSFLELLIANERILQWMEELDKYKNEKSKYVCGTRRGLRCLRNRA